MNKAVVSAVLVAVSCATALPARAHAGPSEVSAASVLVTGSLVVAASTLPIIAAVSIVDAVVHSVHASSNTTTDIEIRQDRTGQTATIRIPTSALHGKQIRVGMRSTLVADQTGHTLKIEDAPVAYVPGRAAEGLLHSKAVK